MSIPNLAKIATADLVEKISSGSFNASYINWARTVQLLREHAPGWMPELVPTQSGDVVHPAPVGAFLLIRFRHTDGNVTPEVPQAIMDSRNGAIPLSKITARDITDTHRRGVCMAAAFTFGLAYELWAKIPLESGYAAEVQEVDSAPVAKLSPHDGVWESLDTDTQIALEKIAISVREFCEAGEADSALVFIEHQRLSTDEKAGLNTLLDSTIRRALKNANESRKKDAA